MSVNRDADLVMVGLRLAEVPFVPPADPAAEPLADDEAGPETDAAAAPAAERAADPAPVPDAPAAADAEAETTPALPVPTATRETGAAATADEGDATPPATISATSGRPNVVIMGRRPDTEPLEAVDSATGTEPRAAAVPLLTEAPTSDDRPATEATAEPETLSETATDPGAAESEGAERSDPPATDPTAPPATTPRNAAAVAIDQPFLQVGIFAQPANAAGLVENLGAEGIRARGITFTQNGRQLTRVVAGPFGSEAERDRALDVIETLGIRDARPSNS
jgi:cell division protein FtsN